MGMLVGERGDQSDDDRIYPEIAGAKGSSMLVIK